MKPVSRQRGGLDWSVSVSWPVNSSCGGRLGGGRPHGATELERPHAGGGDRGDVLLAVNLVGHRRTAGRAGLKLPEQISVFASYAWRLPSGADWNIRPPAVVIAPLGGRAGTPSATPPCSCGCRWRRAPRAKGVETRDTLIERVAEEPRVLARRSQPSEALPVA